MKQIAKNSTRISAVVNNLCTPESYKSVMHVSKYDSIMPSIDELRNMVELLRRILFPGYYAHSDVYPEQMKFYIGANIDKVYRILFEQIHRGFCFACAENGTDICENCKQHSHNLAIKFLEQLPEIRNLLSTDAKAAYEGDPASKSVGEVIFCYPSIRALTNYRIAHVLYELEIPLIPRIITEMAHSETGIDIHPGAKIDKYCFIDHGTGVVIGETCVIGHHARIYQGVTLGAKSFPLDQNGKPVKGIPRHPIIGNNVIIYSGATILGRINIGDNSTIGGNVWLTDSVPENSIILNNNYKKPMNAAKTC